MTKTAQLFLGEPEAAEQLKLTLKRADHTVAENLTAMANSLGVCWFLIGGIGGNPGNPPSIPLKAAIT